jgi:serine/threonine protein kinase/Flp pilus assembly protein TadD
VNQGQRIVLPDLATALALADPVFTIEQTITGGMGTCVKAVHNVSKRAFALKSLKASSVKQRISFERFAQEVKIWSTAASCDVVVEVYCVFRLNEIPCVCSEWMEGGELGRCFQRTDVQFFYLSLDRILAGLDWVYSMYGVVHRDLKPSNILLNAQREPFIADWGIGRAVSFPEDEPRSPISPRSAVDLTQTGQFVGTVLYSAPEQILNAKGIDNHADMYSIGCLMYEWEAGHPPFTGRTPEEIAYQHIQGSAPRLGGFLKRTKFGAEKVIARCLEKKPDDRYRTYAEFRKALRECALPRRIDYHPFQAKRRFSIPLVGAGEIQRSGFKEEVRGSKGYAVVKMRDVLPYLKEADILCELEEWERAHEILTRLYIPEMVSAQPDFEQHQHITVNLGLCLTRMSRNSEAIQVLSSIGSAARKPVAYFVNLTLALVQAGNDAQVEIVAREGLALYPEDPDILGNLALAMMGQRKDSEALDVAQRRLTLSRNIHSIEELALAHMGLAQRALDSEFPRAVQHLALSVKLLSEAKQINPQYVSARLNLAKSYFLLESYQAASDELGNIGQLRVDKSTPALRALMYAECLNRVAAFKECVEFCDKWLQSVPSFVELQRVRAETIVDGYCIGAEKDGARIVEAQTLEFFTTIVENADKRRASDFRYLARLKEWMGDVQTALDLLDKAEQLEPNHWEVSFNRAVFYLHVGEGKTALYHAQKACNLGPWRPQTWRLISVIQDSAQMKPEAEESRLRAEKLTRRRSDVLRSAVPSAV